MQLRGTVKRVIFHNEDSNFYVFTVADTDDNQRTKKAKGNFLFEKPYPGQDVVLEGEWEDTKYGPTFDASEFVPGDLDTQEGIRRYLEHYVDGVGPVTAKRLVDHFGTDTLDILSNDPDRLDEVPNLNKTQRSNLAEEWAKYNEYRDIAIHLLDLDLSNAVVKRIYDEWGSDAVSKVESNPYQLMEIRGIGFVIADRVALAKGVEPDSAFRIGACIEYALKDASQGPGHMYLEANELVSQVYYLIRRNEVADFGRKLTTEDVRTALRDLKERDRIVTDKGKIYLAPLHAYEQRSAELLAEFIGNHDQFEEVDEFIETYEESHNITFSDEQRQAVGAFEDHKVLLLTGLPGTGKCVTPDTLVSGPWGFAPIGDFLPDETAPDTSHEMILDLDTSKGVRPTSYLYDGGVSDTVKITTNFGFSLEGTPEHPVRVVRDAEQMWVKLKDVQDGDVLVLHRGSPYSFGSDLNCLAPLLVEDKQHFNVKMYSTPDRMTPDLARLFGYIVAEGYVVDTNSWSISAHDEQVLTFLEDTLRQGFEYQSSRTFDSRYGKDVDVRLHSTYLIEWFRAQGVDAVRSGGQQVPRAILRASRESMVCFLQALFEGDGAVSEDRKTVEYGTKSETLAQQVQVLLLALGIVASRSQRSNGHWRLFISGKDYCRFKDVVGFHFTSMPSRDVESNTNMHLLHGIAPLVKQLKDEVRPSKGKDYNLFYRASTGRRTPSRNFLKRLLDFGGAPDTRSSLEAYADESLFYDVVSRIDTGRSQVLDFHIPQDHEFLSNGFVSHNTTVTKAIVSLFKSQNLSVQLLSPTGIAAKRLSNVVGTAAATIHRALGYRGEDNPWLYNDSNKLPVDAIIVDEFSMVDQQVLYRLLSALHEDTILVFVGDHAQLPSVGAGNVLHELIRSGQVARVQLTQIFRQEEASDIILNAHRINAGEDPQMLDPMDPNTDFKFIPKDRDTDIVDGILTIVQRIQDKVDRESTFQVLSPRWKSDLGVNNLNERIREVLNPLGQQRETTLRGGMRLREGDRIMVTANDYERGIYNGEIGTVMSIDSKNSEIKIRIRDFGKTKMIPVSYKEAPDLLNLAFCTTIHKSQGNEWDYVLMPFVKGFSIQLQKNLLYTAVTRAKKKVFIFGDWEAIQKAVRNDEVTRRNTILSQRLEDALDS